MADDSEGCAPLNCCLALVVLSFVVWLLGNLFLWGPIFNQGRIPPIVETPPETPQCEPRQRPKALKKSLPKTNCAFCKPPIGVLSPVTVSVRSPDMRYRAIGHFDGTVELVTEPFPGTVWVSTGRKNGSSSIKSAVFSPNGKVLATSDGENVILWSVARGKTGKPLSQKFFPRGGVESIYFSSYDTLVILTRTGRSQVIRFFF